MAVSVSTQRPFCNQKNLEHLFRPGATRRERSLADVIQTLAWYPKHCPCPPRNSHDLKILLEVSILLARVGKL